MKTLILLSSLVSSSAFGATFKADIKGMVCQMCVMGMRKSFGPYVKHKEKDINVNLDDSTLTVRLKEKMEEEKILSLVKDAGYNAENITWIKDNAKKSR